MIGFFDKAASRFRAGGLAGPAALALMIAATPVVAEPIMERAGTCYGATFERDSGPIRDMTARFVRYRDRFADASEPDRALMTWELTEWDVPNQVFGVSTTCSFSDKTIRCGVDCDGGHAILALSKDGKLYFEADQLRYDSLRGDASLLMLNDADGRVMDGLFALSERPESPLCEAEGEQLFVTMQAGDISNRVLDIETKLNRLGQLLDYPDEVFESETRDAVMAFQRQYGLGATGIVDQATAALLANVVQSQAGGC